jgi:cytochrome c-type biogenesis protein CcmH/NrfF
VEIICTPDVADGIAQQLRDAVEEILEGYSDDEIIDYGVD